MKDQATLQERMRSVIEQVNFPHLLQDAIDALDAKDREIERLRATIARVEALCDEAEGVYDPDLDEIRAALKGDNNG